MDHGIHLVDLFNWIIDSKVESVFGRGNISGEKPMSEHMTICYENGAVAHLVSNTITYATSLPGDGIFSWGGSWSSDGSLNVEPHWSEVPASYQILGSKGSLRVFPYAEKLYFFSEAGVKPIELDMRPMPGNFSLQMESFVNSIILKRPLEVDAEDALKALQLVLAAYKSNNSKLSHIDEK